MEDEFYYRNLSCCSVEICWRDFSEEENILYELYQNKDLIYQGNNTSYEVINLNPKEEYIFKLKTKRKGEVLKENKIQIKTLNAPKAIISERSVKIANGESINKTNKLTDQQERIIKNCSNLIFDDKYDNIIKGNFDGIEIKIAHETETNIFYICFDIYPDNFKKFFDKFIEESEKNIIIPCNFLIQKLPTILIFNLLEKGPVILTGKRMGGVIASSLAFYILYIGQTINKNYGNIFVKNDKNCLGVVTFGSPSFLIRLTAAVKMEKFTSYFYNIKAELDYIPVIIDFINKKQDYKALLNIFQKTGDENSDRRVLDKYLYNYNFTEKNLKIDIKLNKIPFGYYYKMVSSNYSLISINECTFEEFYYFKYFHSNDSTINPKIYENLSSKIKFNKESLVFLQNKNDYQIDFVKIIRRNDTSNSLKGIIKFKLIKFNGNIIPPDIINKIILKSNNKSYEIKNKDIYYDNDTDITAYVDNLNENVIQVLINNNFGGEIKVKNIINTQGSGKTRHMLLYNIEKLFLFPFFKLFEILYASLKDNGKYQKLKEENFGNNFNDLKMLISFEKQIHALDELLFFTRPDILGKNEKNFINEYIGDNNKQINYIENKLKLYYEQAKQMQNIMNCNCIDSDKDSTAKKYFFPQKKKEYKKIKKLYMCECDYSKFEKFITEKFNDHYIKPFFIEQLIKEILSNIERDILKDLNNKNEEQIKNLLIEKIGEFHNKEIIPNAHFIYILILSSIESGDEIIFNHNIDGKKLSENFHFSISFPITLLIGNRGRSNYEKDFEKNYNCEQIEDIYMKNLFYKTKIKDIINSNISPKNSKRDLSHQYLDYYIPFFFEFIDIVQIQENKIYNFSEYSEKQIWGKKYYENFLHLLNNYSNDFIEDIELSIYDNLKEENKNRNTNFLAIKDIMNNLIDDEESKKGFLALLRQSYILGRLRCLIVSKYIIKLFNFIF